MRKPVPGIFPLLFLLLGSFSPRVAAQTPAELAVQETARDFLLALSAADTAALAELLLPEAMIYSVRQGEDGAVLGSRTRASFLQGLGEDPRGLLERMWNPTVLVRERVAMVWTPYDFHLDGVFSHCGVDVFTLLRGPHGWKVASITYDVVREGCPPSPLGPPGG